MTECLGVDLVSREQAISLPPEINAECKGERRNTKIKEAISSLSLKNLVMAQPFLDEKIEGSYHIPPETVIELNDKKNKHVLIPKKYLPKEYKIFVTGRELAESTEIFPLPLVAKVSSLVLETASGSATSKQTWSGPKRSSRTSAAQFSSKS